MDNLHPVQMKILTKLLYSQDLRYTEMKPRKSLENNAFQFHLDRLVALGLVVKVGKSYLLTKNGKKLTLQIKGETAQLTKQTRVGVAMGCTREHFGKTQVLIYTRLKQAYYGCQGFPTGKVEQGEDILKAGKRELIEETGLKGKPELVGIFHYRIFNNNGSELLDDLLLFLCRFINPVGQLVSNHEGRYEWVSVDSLPQKITKPFQSKEWFLEEVGQLFKNNGKIDLVEKSFNDITNF